MSKVPHSSTGEMAKGLEQVKGAASNVVHNVTNAASYVRQKAEDMIPSEQEIVKGIEHAKDAASNVAHNVSNAALYVRQKADGATTAVGGVLENTGHYLREDGIDSIAIGVTHLVRRNPIRAVLASMAVGYLLAQATCSRSGT